MICSSRDIWQTLSFYPQQNLKNQNFDDDDDDDDDDDAYHHFTHVNQNSQSYDKQLLRYRVRQTEFLVILGHFLPFHSLTNQKIKILKN